MHSSAESTGSPIHLEFEPERVDGKWLYRIYRSLRDFLRGHFIRRLLENYCFVLLTNGAPPQISHNRPDMKHRALFVTSRAAWRWNKMLLAGEIVDSPLAAMVLATEHNALCASGCQPPSVDNGTDSRLNPVPADWRILLYLETLAVHVAFNRFRGFSTTSWILAWLSGWQIVTSKSSVPPLLRSARISGLSL